MAVEWHISRSPVDYEEAVAFMEAQVASIAETRGQGLGKEKKEQERNTKAQDGKASKKKNNGQEMQPCNLSPRHPGTRSPKPETCNPASRFSTLETVWLLEHPPLYTAGTSAKEGDLLERARFPVYASGRGGQYTYHGPGQRVGYVMLDLKSRYAPAVPDLRDYVQKLERWLILTLDQFGVRGELREGRIGIWVATPYGEKKIAALGVRVRSGVSFHGVALNVCPDLSHFSGIVPCGIREHGVTSLRDLGVKVSMDAVDQVLKGTFADVFDTRT